jgi:hypothetical protein
MSAKKGSIPWNKGKPASEEFCRKMSVAIKCKWQDPDYRKHMQEVHKGEIPPEQRAKMVEGARMRMQTQEYKDNMRAANTRRYSDPSEREKISNASKELWKDPIKTAIRIKHIAETKSRPEIKEKIRTSQIKRWEDNAEELLKYSENAKARWRDPVYREAVSKKIKAAKNDPSNIAAVSGENSHAWRGGKSFEPYCPKFNKFVREEIRERFDRACLLCGTHENGRRLSIHHVDYNKNDMCNGMKWALIPLCTSCHAKNKFRSTFLFQSMDKLLGNESRNQNL